MGFENLKDIRVDIADGVATLTLNRPDRLNAYDAAMGVELFGSMHELDLDDAVRAIVITGAGKHFCAGAALAEDGSTFASEDAFAAATALEAKVRPWNMRTPVIGAINGAAVGIGATLPLLWDIRICADNSKFGFVFTRRGIVPEANSTWVLPRLIGLSNAMDLLLTGRFVRADEARSLGLVSRVVPAAELAGVAREMAVDIAENTAPVSAGITKRLVWRQLMQTDPRAAKKLEDELFHWAGAQPDAAEGVKSFLEKRRPEWTMSATRDLPSPIDDLAD